MLTILLCREGKRGVSLVPSGNRVSRIRPKGQISPLVIELPSPPLSSHTANTGYTVHTLHHLTPPLPCCACATTVSKRARLPSACGDVLRLCALVFFCLCNFTLLLLFVSIGFIAFWSLASRGPIKLCSPLPPSIQALTFVAKYRIKYIPLYAQSLSDTLLVGSALHLFTASVINCYLCQTCRALKENLCSCLSMVYTMIPCYRHIQKPCTCNCNRRNAALALLKYSDHGHHQHHVNYGTSVQLMSIAETTPAVIV